MNYSLYLYSTDTAGGVESAPALQKHLANHRFILPDCAAEKISPGDQLMSYINYLGCSPTLLAGDTDVSIKIHVFDKLTALGGESIETIRYPGCKHPVQEPSQLVQDFINTTGWRCPACGNSGKFEQINWRKSAAISNLFIEISPVFPKEAIPSDELLSMLNEFNQSAWQWFYSRSSAADL